MNRQQKENLIQGLSEKFTVNEAAFIVKYQGLSVPELQELRFKLEVKNGVFKVAKNRLMKLAMSKEAECLGMLSLMKGQTGLVFVKSDYTGVAKVLADFAKKHEEFVIVAGCCESQLFDGVSVTKKLALIPSKEVLLAQLCGVLNAPVAQFVWVLSQVLAQKIGPVVEPAQESAPEVVAEPTEEQQ